MKGRTILVGTWNQGLVVISGDSRHLECQDLSVRGLAPDGRGGALALLGGHTLHRRADDGTWTTLAESELELSCCLAAGGSIFVGTDDARLLRHVDGTLESLVGFDHVEGRDAWYAATAVVDGRVVGPPLGIRSMTATSDGKVLFASVHVGGIPRSMDGGATWQPTLEIDSDVHEVRAHPADAGLVIAATALGLFVSRDAGYTWKREHEGLHATYCSAVEFCGEDLLLAAATDHFAAKGGVYRRPISGKGPLERVGGGLPKWIDGICDTGCIATRGATCALVDKAGNLFQSSDRGKTWSPLAGRLPGTSCLLVV